MKHYTLIHMHSIWRPTFIILIILLLAGCSPFGLFSKKEKEPKEPKIPEGENAAVLYQAAHNSLLKQDINAAIEEFELLESRYPFGRHAQQAQLELAYAYYKQNDTDNALRSINRFIQLNPQHPNLDYAYYLKGLITFDKGKSFIHFFLGRNPSNNDPTPLIEAFQTFSALIEKFPDSEYARDAQQRSVYLRNELAEYELNVADFYMRRGAYVASANRAKYIMENYQGAAVMPQAVAMLEKAYRKLGIDDLAQDTSRVFDQNFTEADLYIDNTVCKKSTFRSIAEYLFFLEKKGCKK